MHAAVCLWRSWGIQFNEHLQTLNDTGFWSVCNPTMTFMVAALETNVSRYL